MDNILPKRKHPRLKEFDYSTPGAYFITICAHKRRHLFAQITDVPYGDAIIQYTPYGNVAKEQLLQLKKRYPQIKIEHYTIMPNHIHMIISLNNEAQSSITDIICAYKSLTVQACRKMQLQEKVFQTSFHDHVIRNQQDYDEIARYIENNPKQWALDHLYTEE